LQEERKQFKSEKFTSANQRMRSLNFGFLNSFFQQQLKGQSRKIIYTFYAVPAAVAFGVALLNYGTTSFGVYLKYQALVDCYHERKTA